MENGSSAAELPRVGFSIGEPGGIGPQLLFQLLAQEGWEDRFIPVIFAHRRVVERWRGFLGLSTLRYHRISRPEEAQPGQLNLMECAPLQDILIGKPSAEGGRLARQAFQAAVQAAQAGSLNLLVSLPVDKSTFYEEETFPYRGHTEYLRALYPDTPPLMVMVGQTLRVALVTEHLPLAEVASALSAEKVEQALRTFIAALKRDFAVPKPRIAVLALNPHAGDEGLLGKEEKTWLAPLLEKFREEGHFIGGPFAADGFFGSRQYTQVEGILALYHDQGLIPFKLLEGWEGFQYTAGLPFVRTSPDHGVAYDKVGREEADPSSLSSAIWEGLAIWHRRQAHP
ncbi:MAG: 4-hydroxythreonine-4-phosphate dehydrogenase [Bacteroidia bacterium]|nr:MAG: 4-hydroxythreonine-4-phosphate dehydrogenase [Bacteroidia bacterium]